MATNNYYEIYKTSIMDLVRTIVIKSQTTIEAINSYMVSLHGEQAVDPLHPETWKYYMNIAGEYHSTDEEMTIVSLDTLETIVFNRENLKLHTATARAYQYGTRSFKDLMNRYPQQELLILGILYPADKQKAIAADDWAILSYPAELVETNEYSLIDKIQTWLNNFKLRWVNDQFSISDNLYTASSLAVMYAMLGNAIEAFRLDACNTNEAHSFHVRQYLASHGIKDSYIDNLTLKQSLFLYRNIRYIQKHAGHTDTFKLLVEHIMTERNLPLAEYRMRHDSTHQPAHLYPDITFVKIPLNDSYSLDSKVESTIATMLQKESKAARENSKYLTDVEANIREQMENSKSDTLLTKVLESSMVDYSDSTPYTLSDVLVNHWLYLATIGMFNSYIRIINPKTGETISLSVKDAYTFMYYAMLSSAGIPVTNIPTVQAYRVQRTPLPTPSDLLSVADSRYATLEQAKYIVGLNPALRPVISIEAFYQECLKIYEAANKQWEFKASQEHFERRGAVANMVTRVYHDPICTLDSATSYARWFAARNIIISDFSRDDLEAAYKQILADATGLSLHPHASAKDLQDAMVGIMRQLSSYTIQFLTEINASTIKPVDWAVIRVGDIDAEGVSGAEVESSTVTALSQKASGAFGIVFDTDDKVFTLSQKATAKIDFPYDVKTPFSFEHGSVSFPMYLDIGGVGIIANDSVIPNNDGMPTVPGTEHFLSLTIEQRRKLWDNYNNRPF